MNDLTNKIQELDKKNQENKVEQAKVQERIKALKEEKEKILKELTSLDVKPEDLKSTIEKLKNEMNDKIKEIEEVLK